MEIPAKIYSITLDKNDKRDFVPLTDFHKQRSGITSAKSVIFIRLYVYKFNIYAIK